MSTTAQPQTAARTKTLFNRVVFSNGVIHPIWRLLLFGLTMWFLQERFVRQFTRLIAINFLPKGSLAISAAGEVGPWADILGAGLRFLAVLAASWALSKIERRPLGDYGLPLRTASAKWFSSGAAMGLLGMALLLLALRAFGAYSFGAIATSGTSAIRAAILWIVACLAVALYEEFLFRGFLLVTGTKILGFWPASLALSIWFALAHTENPGENFLGLLSVFVFGMLFCLMVRRTGSLWLAVGFHFGWNLAETFIFGVPDSGVTSRGRLLAPVFHGPSWLTGGTAGPEGSALCFLLVALLALLVHRASSSPPSSSPKMRSLRMRRLNSYMVAGLYISAITIPTTTHCTKQAAACPTASLSPML